MKPQEVKYEILCEIEGERPHIQIGFQFRDYFETNTYYLISECADYPFSKNLEFDVVKDGKEIGKVYLKENNVKGMIEEFLSETNDFDLKKQVLSKHQENVEKDVLAFFEHYRKTIIESRSSLTGELKRMRSVAGII